MRPTPDRILEAAERSMTRYGVSVSMGDVASAAGVSRGSLYRHFGDRDQLLRAVLARVADRFVASAAARIDRRRTLSAQFAEAVAYVTTTARRLQRDLGPGTRRARRSPLAIVVLEQPDWTAERWMAFWEARLEPACSRGELRADIDRRETAEWLSRALVSFAVAPELEIDPADHRAVRRFVDRSLLRGLAG